MKLFASTSSDIEKTNRLISAKKRANPSSPRMYPAEKTAIQVATNVTVASMIAESGSTWITNFAAKWPASNHVTGTLRKETWLPSVAATCTSTTIASTAAPPNEAIAGRWREPPERAWRCITAVRTAAASGRASAIRASSTGPGLDTGRLLLGLRPGRRQGRVRRLRLR